MIRYMGTKRFLADPVAQIISDLPPRHANARVVDLFCGTGAATSELDGVASVVMNDASAFLGPLLRSRFVHEERVAPFRLLDQLAPHYEARCKALGAEFDGRLQHERDVLLGKPSDLLAYMEDVPHVGTSNEYRRQARLAARRRGPGRYCLTVLYFSGGYFSTWQAVQLDAIRYAIASLDDERSYDQALAAFLGTVDRCLNSPGHSAQFLRPNSEAAHKRIVRLWRRDVWSVFVDTLAEFAPSGSSAWRVENEYQNGDALDLLPQLKSDQVRAVYADPPYTKDQYSRYYHVHETLFLYDFPDSIGRGRYRAGRFSSTFSESGSVESAFEDLLRGVSALGIPLVLSYPERSLLSRRGTDIRDLATKHFRTIITHSFATKHSTLGASKGASTNDNTEFIHVLTN